MNSALHATLSLERHRPTITAACTHHDDLVALVLAADVLVRRSQEAVRLLQVDHRAVKRVEVLVAQERRVADVPAAPALVQRAAVTGDEAAGGGVVAVDAGEVDPLGVPKLVAHEVKVRLAAQGEGDEANHLVKGNAAVDDWRLGAEAGQRHAVIHRLVHLRRGWQVRGVWGEV